MKASQAESVGYIRMCDVDLAVIQLLHSVATDISVRMFHRSCYKVDIGALTHLCSS